MGRRAVERQLGHEPAALRLIQQDGLAGVLQRSDAVEHHVVERQARQLAPREREASEPASARDEDLKPLAAVRRVGHDEAAVVRVDVERGWIEHAAGLLADLDDLLRARPPSLPCRPRGLVDRRRKYVSFVSLLKPDRRQKRAGDMCRQSAD